MLLAFLVLTGLLVAAIADTVGSTAEQRNDRSTEGTLDFSVRTVTYYGQYAPRNAGVIWITNAQNQFVKTIKLWASQYSYTLVRWMASSGGNTTGAVTGASLNNHQLHNVTWNGRNHQNIEVPDGEYKINVEFTEHNATAANLGKYLQISFVKGPDPLNETYPNQTYFQNLSLVWTPVVADGRIFGTVTNGNSSPISSALVQAGGFNAITDAAGQFSLVLPPGNYDLSCSANGYQTEYLTGVEVTSGQDVQVNFTLQGVSNSDLLNPANGLFLQPPYPNPFQTSVRFRFASDRAEPVRLIIYNSRGQKVWERILAGAKGETELVWNAIDHKGIRYPAGRYTIVLRQGEQSRQRQIILLP